MRNKILYLVSLLSLSLIFGSCQKDEESGRIGNGKSMEVKFRFDGMKEFQETGSNARGAHVQGESQTVTKELENGMVMEATIVPDQSDGATTRGMTAIDPATKIVIIAFHNGRPYKKKTTTPGDASIELPMGETYDFVFYCNNGSSQPPTILTDSSWSFEDGLYPEGETGLIGGANQSKNENDQLWHKVENVRVSADMSPLSVIFQHLFSRVRLQVTDKYSRISSCDSYVTPTADYLSVDVVTGVFNQISNDWLDVGFTFPTLNARSITSNYEACRPVTNMGVYIGLGMEVGGYLYYTGVDFSDYKLQGGKSYTIKINTTSPLFSNCYVVPVEGTVDIPVLRANQSPIPIGSYVNQQFTFGDTWTAEIVWQEAGMNVTLPVSSGEGPLGNIKVAAGSMEGNAVVAIRKNSTNEILWSWHIWVSNWDPNLPENQFPWDSTGDGVNDIVFMGRNLGASSNAHNDGSHGLHYQWGRKDPFPNFIVTLPSSSKELSLTESVRNPGSFITPAHGKDWFGTTVSYENLWGGENRFTPSPKTVFDPCPVGWRVPTFSHNISPFARMNQKYVDDNNSDFDNDLGIQWNRENPSSFFPTGNYRIDYTPVLIAEPRGGVYWTASKMSNLEITMGNIYQEDYASGNGCSVRCIKE